MPIKNDPETNWVGWLIDSARGRNEEFEHTLLEALTTRNLPMYGREDSGSAEIKSGTTNMWWRKDSRYIDLKTQLDGTIECTIHIQDYGSSLFIGVAAQKPDERDNYYKRMATMAFIESIERVVVGTIMGLTTEDTVHAVTKKNWGTQG